MWERRTLSGLNSSGPITVALAAMLGSCTLTSAAEITPVTQTRYVTAFADGWIEGGPLTDADDDAASDFELFDSTASASIGVASATAQQTSTIGLDSIHLDGTAAASGTAGACPLHGGEGLAQSVFDVTFDVDEMTPFTLAVFLTTAKADSEGTSSVSYTLSGPGGFEMIEGDIDSTDVAPMIVSGTMLSGTYTFTVTAHCEAGHNNSATATYEATVTLEEPAALTPLIDLDVVSTDRATSVWSDAGCPGCPPDFCIPESFDEGTTGLESFDSSLFADTNGGQAFAQATASQHSSITEHAIFARGLVSGDTSALTKGGCIAYADAESTAIVTFQTSETIVVEVLALVADAVVTLSGSGVLIDGHGHIHTRITLEPGTYQLTADASVSQKPPFCINVGTEQGSFEVALVATTDQPLCGVDLTGDNEVTVVDLIEMLGHWGACDEPLPILCPWDVNQDGTIDVNDLLTLLAGWGPCV